MQASAFTLSECETNSCSRRGCVRFAWMSHTFTLLSQLLVAISGKRGFSAVKATPSPCVSERGRTYREDGHAGHQLVVRHLVLRLRLRDAAQQLLHRNLRLRKRPRPPSSGRPPTWSPPPSRPACTGASCRRMTAIAGTGRHSARTGLSRRPCADSYTSSRAPFATAGCSGPSPRECTCAISRPTRESCCRAHR